MTNSMALRIAAVTGFLGVALGAFGAHGMEARLEEFGTGEIWRTAVLYHLIHAVVLFVLAGKEPFHRGPWICFVLGIFVFSGTLYVLAGTGMRWLGAITPIGGVLFLIGWAWLFLQPKFPEARR
jgi:uncharacterized membrane protein YgdD (TMEM256/DUF423 family)